MAKDIGDANRWLQLNSLEPEAGEISDIVETTDGPILDNSAQDIIFDVLPDGTPDPVFIDPDE